MAKRFTDTNKWTKGFVRGLKGPYKLLWLYICDMCDHAGIWEVEIDVASLRIGVDVTEDGALSEFGEKIQVFDDGRKWFIPSFIEFQYGSLNPGNRVHSSVISRLEKYGLYKPLTSPLQGAKDKENDKDKEKNKDKGSTSRFAKPELDEVVSEFSAKGHPEQARPFYDYYESNGWKVGKNSMKDWKAAVRNWLRNAKDFKITKGTVRPPRPADDFGEL